jgi:hypothetical protein
VLHGNGYTEAVMRDKYHVRYRVETIALVVGIKKGHANVLPNFGDLPKRKLLVISESPEPTP